MKKIFPLIILISLLLLSSCSVTRNRYHAPSSLDKIELRIYEQLQGVPLAEMDDDNYEFLLTLNEDDYEDGFVFVSSSGATIDEVGVFLADNQKTDLLYEKIESYVNECKETKEEWLNSYNPEESKKLQNGSVFRYGNCIGYTFLDSELSSKIQKEIEEMLQS